MSEPLPLATIQDAVLEFLRNRDDAALFGAQAVNAYVDAPRMTQDVDILSTRAAALAEELRTSLANQFHIAVLRTVADGKGYRIFQLRQPKNRHLVGVRQISNFPPTQIVAQVRVLVPEELIAQKIISSCASRGQPKSDTDRRDLKVLLLAHPQLKTLSGPVWDRLLASGANEQSLEEWRKTVASEIIPEESEDIDQD